MELCAKEFFQEIKEAIGPKNEEHLYCTQTASSYFADFRPDYPNETNGDFLIVYDIPTGSLCMIARTSTVPIFKAYDSFDKLLNDLKNIDY